jgi:hypothetical protein
MPTSHSPSEAIQASTNDGSQTVTAAQGKFEQAIADATTGDKNLYTMPFTNSSGETTNLTDATRSYNELAAAEAIAQGELDTLHGTQSALSEKLKAINTTPNPELAAKNEQQALLELQGQSFTPEQEQSWQDKIQTYESDRIAQRIETANQLHNIADEISGKEQYITALDQNQAQHLDATDTFLKESFSEDASDAYRDMVHAQKENIAHTNEQNSNTPPPSYGDITEILNDSTNNYTGTSTNPDVIAAVNTAKQSQDAFSDLVSQHTPGNYSTDQESQSLNINPMDMLRGTPLSTKDGRSSSFGAIDASINTRQNEILATQDSIDVLEQEKANLIQNAEEISYTQMDNNEKTALLQRNASQLQQVSDEITTSQETLKTLQDEKSGSIDTLASYVAQNVSPDAAAQYREMKNNQDDVAEARHLDNQESSVNIPNTDSQNSTAPAQSKTETPHLQEAANSSVQTVGQTETPTMMNDNGTNQTSGIYDMPNSPTAKEIIDKSSIDSKEPSASIPSTTASDYDFIPSEPGLVSPSDGTNSDIPYESAPLQANQGAQSNDKTANKNRQTATTNTQPHSDVLNQNIASNTPSSEDSAHVVSNDQSTVQTHQADNNSSITPIHSTPIIQDSNSTPEFIDATTPESFTNLQTPLHANNNTPIHSNTQDSNNTQSNINSTESVQSATDTNTVPTFINASGQETQTNTQGIYQEPIAHTRLTDASENVNSVTPITATETPETNQTVQDTPNNQAQIQTNVDNLATADVDPITTSTKDSVKDTQSINSDITSTSPTSSPIIQDDSSIPEFIKSADLDVDNDVPTTIDTNSSDTLNTNVSPITESTQNNITDTQSVVRDETPTHNTHSTPIITDSNQAPAFINATNLNNDTTKSNVSPIDSLSENKTTVTSPDTNAHNNTGVTAQGINNTTSPEFINATGQDTAAREHGIYKDPASTDSSDLTYTDFPNEAVPSKGHAETNIHNNATTNPSMPYEEFSNQSEFFNSEEPQDDNNEINVTQTPEVPYSANKLSDDQFIGLDGNNIPIDLTSDVFTPQDNTSQSQPTHAQTHAQTLQNTISDLTDMRDRQEKEYNNLENPTQKQQLEHIMAQSEITSEIHENQLELAKTHTEDFEPTPETLITDIPKDQVDFKIDTPESIKEDRLSQIKSDEESIDTLQDENKTLQDALDALDLGRASSSSMPQTNEIQPEFSTPQSNAQNSGETLHQGESSDTPIEEAIQNTLKASNSTPIDGRERNERIDDMLAGFRETKTLDEVYADNANQQLDSELGASNAYSKGTDIDSNAFVKSGEHGALSSLKSSLATISALGGVDLASDFAGNSALAKTLGDQANMTGAFKSALKGQYPRKSDAELDKMAKSLSTNFQQNSGEFYESMKSLQAMQQSNAVAKTDAERTTFDTFGSETAQAKTAQREATESTETSKAITDSLHNATASQNIVDQMMKTADKKQARGPLIKRLEESGLGKITENGGFEVSKDANKRISAFAKLRALDRDNNAMTIDGTTYNVSQGSVDGSVRVDANDGSLLTTGDGITNRFGTNYTNTAQSMMALMGLDPMDPNSQSMALVQATMMLGGGAAAFSMAKSALGMSGGGKGMGAKKPSFDANGNPTNMAPKSKVGKLFQKIQNGPMRFNGAAAFTGGSAVAMGLMGNDGSAIQKLMSSEAISYAATGLTVGGSTFGVAGAVGGAAAGLAVAGGKYIYDNYIKDDAPSALNAGMQTPAHTIPGGASANANFSESPQITKAVQNNTSRLTQKERQENSKTFKDVQNSYAIGGNINTPEGDKSLTFKSGNLKYGDQATSISKQDFKDYFSEDTDNSRGDTFLSSLSHHVSDGSDISGIRSMEGLQDYFNSVQ